MGLEIGQGRQVERVTNSATTVAWINNHDAVEEEWVRWLLMIKFNLGSETGDSTVTTFFLEDGEIVLTKSEAN